MQRERSHLNSAVQMISTYQGKEPFSSFQKKFFSQQKKYGSTDRKQITHLCYCYFRLGKALMELPTDERILVGLFLSSRSANSVLEKLKPLWNDLVANSFAEKCRILHSGAALINEIFPWNNELSAGIELEDFVEAFFIQPNLFLRLRPGFEGSVRQKLSEAGVHFQALNESCLELANQSKIEDIVELDKEAVVQDYSSQRTSDSFHMATDHAAKKIKVWDCCAGSGGKSLLFYDLDPNIYLTVTDKRESITANLKKRLSRAGVSGFDSRVVDLTESKLAKSAFDVIICDAPCSGSGTWGRTPEQLHFFDGEKINQYSSLQKKIVAAIVPALKKHGFLFYITCSVFANENDEIVDFLAKEFSLDLLEKKLLTGYRKKADTLFISSFQNRS